MKVKNNHLKVTLIVIGAFIVALYSYSVISYLGGDFLKIFPSEVSVILRYFTWFIAVVLALVVLYGPNIKLLLTELGLQSDFIKGISFAFLATVPMLAGYFFVSKTISISLLIILKLALLPGIMEELLFRGFVFGQLYRRASWGFIPAVAISSLFFGIGHLYQSYNIASVIAIFFVTFIGGGWFAWLYIEWDENLWIPIGLHFFMNLWWIIFKVGNTVLGGWYANIFRILTIVITVVITIYRGKVKRGVSLI